MFNLPLTKRYILAVTLLAVFIAFSHFLVNEVVVSNNKLAKIINISGKQRMLSQRLIILGKNYYEDQKHEKDFKNALFEIRKSHKYLLTQNFTKKLNDIYFNNKNNLDKKLKSYLNHFDNLIITHDLLYLKLARKDSKNILNKLDTAVKEYERYANEKLNITSDYEFYIMIITLLILVFEVIFIFRPAASQIEQNTNKLEIKEEYEATVIEANNNAVVAIDWEGRITTFNSKAVEIFGWSKDEMIGYKNVDKIIPQKYKSRHKKALGLFLKNGNSMGAINNTQELEGLKKDGTIFPILISFGASWKEKHTIVIASITDISKEKEQHNILIQQSKMASLGEMLGNIAHQWRQPLSAISSSATGAILERELGILSEDELKKKLEQIVGKAQYLSQTIEDFRNFFKQENKKTKFNIVSTINNVENIINATLKIDNILLIKFYNENTKIYCNGFPNELSQVVINILNNAKDILMDKNKKNKIIKICLSHDKNMINIRIHDNAGGIPEDIMPKIFEPYFTTKHQSQGTGIGLYMSSEIIQGHFGGRLLAYNRDFIIKKEKYFGACFEIIIPANTEQED